MPLNEETYQAILDGMLHAHSRQLDRLEDEVRDLRSSLLALGHDVAGLRAALQLLTEATKEPKKGRHDAAQVHPPKP